MLTALRAFSMARTKRMRAAIVKLLEAEGKCNTRRIYDHVNNSSKWGATMNQIGNVLAKDARFIKSTETERVEAIQGGGYRVCVWDLKSRGNNDESQM
jgi:predicted transcriptional regulator